LPSESITKVRAVFTTISEYKISINKIGKHILLIVDMVLTILCACKYPASILEAIVNMGLTMLTHNLCSRFSASLNAPLIQDQKLFLAAFYAFSLARQSGEHGPGNRFI